MRVLHLTPELPYWPGGSGGATRQFHLLRRLAGLGHEVTVVAPYTSEQANGVPALADAGIRFEGLPRPGSQVTESLLALGREPRLALRAASLPLLAWQVSVFWTALRPLARRTASEWRPDVLSVEHDNAAGWAADLRGVPAVLTFQNVGWLYYRSRAAAAGGVARVAYDLEARRFRRHDLRHVSRYRMLIAMSERDREDLEQATGGAVEVVPNGVASDELTPAGEAPDPPTLLFSGTMSHPPNAEGVLWFAERIWPRVRSEVGDARLLVVGRDPPRSVRRLAGEDGIEVTGFVPSIAPYFARSAAVVVPLLSGGGTRLKVLEAFAARRAVVSTSVGVEGLEVRAGREVLVADDAAGFAAAAIRLLRDRALREELAAAGRAVAEERYDWRVLGERFAAVLEAATGASLRRSSLR